MTSRTTAGFSVIEALVALAIVALVLMPLIALQTQVTRTFGRQAQLHDRMTAQRNALAVLREINLMPEPVGERRLAPGTRLHWIARPISRPARSIEFLGQAGRFDVALYRADAVVETGAGPIASFAIEQVGWRLR
jgi:general secretion pathway protein I